MKRHSTPRFAQPMHICTARGNWTQVIIGAVKDMERRTDVLVFKKACVATWIERQLTRKAESLWRVHALETAHPRVKRSASPPRETHDHDTLRVYAWVFGDMVERAIGIVKRSERWHLVRIINGIRQAASGVEIE